MKRSMGNSIYNTSTAKRIGSWSNNIAGSGWIIETLFKNKAGKYFLHGCGGSSTRYATQSNGEWSEGEKLVPLDVDTARAWAAEHLETIEYDREFGKLKQVEGKVAMNINMPIALKNELERIKAETGKSISQLIAEKFE